MADSPFELTANALKEIIDTEFAAEGYKAIFDNLHESLGRKRVTVGIAPSEDVVMISNNNVQETWIDVKFYHLWKDEIDPETVINPIKITAFAERFRTAIRNSRALTDPATGQVWYFSLMRIRYPDDPTGNKSRFVATIKAWGNNAAIVETV